MLLERTIRQLDTGPISPEEARQLGHLGYMQWLAALPGGADYLGEAFKAHRQAAPRAGGSPAISEFCSLLMTTIEEPLKPLMLVLPSTQRRGGSKTRRMRRTPF